LCLLQLALASGCAPVEADADPSAASSGLWLTPCPDAGDCQAGACLHSTCTLGCALDSLEICGAELSADAVCDTERKSCEVPCAGPTACAVLGPGYACVEGRCRGTDLAR
jgi:hypothetical protein